MILVCITPTQLRKCRRYMITFAQRLIHQWRGCARCTSHTGMWPQTLVLALPPGVLLKPSDQFSSVQLLSHARLFVTP